VTLAKLSVNAWLVLLVLILGVAFTALAIVNRARDGVESRMREFGRDFMALEPRRIKSALFLLGKAGRQDDVDPVLDFFEDLGYALKNGAITIESAYQDFDSWVEPYWLSCCHYILKVQEDDPETWCNIFPLYQAMRKRDGGDPWTDDDVRVALEGDANLQ